MKGCALVGFDDIKISRNDRSVAAERMVAGADRPLAGTLTTAMVSGPGGTVLDVGVFIPEADGRGEIWCREKVGGPPELKELEGSKRLGLQRTPEGEPFVELGVLVPQGVDRRPAKKFLPRDEFAIQVGGDPEELLLDRGVLRVGTREELFGEANRRRGILAAELPADDPIDAALACYCLINVVPLLRDVEGRA